MSMCSEIPCWKIVKCNQKHACLLVRDEQKACWEVVAENDGYLFHICVDCLVYMVKHEDATLTDEEFCFIMEQRHKKSPAEYGEEPLYRVTCPASRPEKFMKNTHLTHKETVPV